MLFLKPFKIRTNVILREPKRRKLVQKVTENLGLSADGADLIFKGKTASEIKIHTSTRHEILSYLFDGVPMVFLYEAVIADTAAHERCSKPLAVGICSMGIDEFKAAGDEDRVIHILHTLNDKLTELCPPHLLESYRLRDTIELKYTEPIISIGAPNGEATPNDDSPELDMDNLLMFCFLYGLRKLKPADLPLPVNVFYAKHMKADCPNGREVDVRKTSFKKLSVFLEKMAAEGIIALETVDVGITRLTAFKKDHPVLQKLEQSFPELAKSSADADDSSIGSKFVVGDFYFGPPVLKEIRIITPRIAPLFVSAGYRAGDSIEQSIICRVVGAYIDSNNLRSAENSDLANIDGLLARICEPNLLKESPESTLAEPRFQITFQDLITSLTRGLQVAYRITYPRESGLEPMITTNNKSLKLYLYGAKQNGKDVTRIAGLSNFGIDVKPFSRYIQTKLACSACLTEDPRHGNSVVVQAQGRHVTALSKIMTDTFGISKKWIEGYEESPKKKAGRK